MDSLEMITSNRIASGKTLAIELQSSYQDIANRPGVLNSDPGRTEPRTFDADDEYISCLFKVIYDYCLIGDVWGALKNGHLMQTD